MVVVEDLSRYPRPNVAVDVAVFTVAPGAGGDQLVTLLLESRGEPGGLAVPGRFLREGESIADCASVALREKADLDVASIKPRLLRVFDDPDRDPRGWTVSLAHYLAVPAPRVHGHLAPVDALPHLLFDHAEIVTEAAARIRTRYELHPDPDGMLEGPFTLSDLRRLHEAVLGEPIQRDTFRRRMEPHLEPYVERGQPASRIDGGRPARLWLTRSETAPTPPERIRLPRSSPAPRR